MKKSQPSLLSILVVVTFAFLNYGSFAQCAVGPTIGIFAPSTGTTFLSLTNYSPGNAFDVPMLNGGSYAISTCGATLNTQITGWNAAATSTLFYNDDNGPLCTGLQASVDNYIPAFTGYARVQISQFNCLTNGSSSINVLIRQNNNLAFTSSTAQICSGQSRTLSAIPANVGASPGNYGDPGTFSGIGVNANVFTAPVVSVPTSYTLTYTFGYVSTTQVILVNPLPVLIASVSNSAVCLGQSVTVSASGASTYTWSGGITNGVSFIPQSSSTYSVVGTSSAGCVSSNSAITGVLVNTPPVISASVSNLVICMGATTSLIASGADTYSWSGGVVNGVPFSPSVTNVYSVTGTSTLTGCTSQVLTQTVIVNQLPNVTIIPTKSISCKEDLISLFAAGANSYTWANGATSTIITVSPGVTSTYSLTGKDANNCINTAVFTLTVTNCTNLQNLQNDAGNLSVFPNPAHGIVKIKSDVMGKLSVINETGLLMHELELNESNNFTFEYSSLSPGIYFVIFQNNHQLIRRKIVVNNVVNR